MIMAGQSKAQIIDALKVAYEKKELPAIEPGAMSYMMSKDQYLTDHGDHHQGDAVHDRHLQVQ